MGGVKFVNYFGPKYGNEKNTFFSNADIFVFPTYNETFGLVNLEAMQYKLPIVTTNEGGIPDVVQNGINGYVCEREDSVTLANAIERLLNNKNSCIELGENGYKIFKQQFTKEQFEYEITKLLKAIRESLISKS